MLNLQVDSYNLKVVLYSIIITSNHKKISIMKEKQPLAVMVIIGNEVLSGRTEDKNLNFLAKGLGKIGVTLFEVRVIPDVQSLIINTVNELRKKFDYVFTTGGIGPTHDDITTEAIAKAFDVPLLRHEESYKKIEAYYKGELNEGRIKMVTLPKGAKPINNVISAAPGFYIENVYVMAGIPNVMQAMFDDIKHTLKGGDLIMSKEIVIYASESKMAPTLTNAQNKYQQVEIGSYPFVHDNKFGVSVVLRSSDSKLLNMSFEHLVDKLKEFGEILI